jgi:hypothetical protein
MPAGEALGDAGDRDLRDPTDGSTCSERPQNRDVVRVDKIRA